MKTVMVIEDNVSIREEIETILELEGFRVVSFGNGLAGLEAYKSHRPDLILCDIMMPEMDGYQFYNHIKELDPAPGIPFIYITAKASRTDQRKGMIDGADDYIVKPFTAEELVQSIRSRLERQETIKAPLQREVESLRNTLNNTLPQELLVPLNGIVGIAKVILELPDDSGMDKVRDLARSIQLSGTLLKSKIYNYLLHAQLNVWSYDDAMVQELRSSSADLSGEIVHQFVIDVLQRHRRLADLRVTIEPAKVAISKEYVAKIFAELIDNALKFSGSGTAVLVQGSVEAGDEYKITVQNEGVEFHYREGNGGEYDRYDIEKSLREGDAGLGIVRRIIEIHGGRFQIASEADRFTRVTVALPLAKE